MFKKLFAVLAGFAALLAAQSSYAVIDVTTVTTGITDAQTAILAVVAGLMTMYAALFGINMVLRFIKRRSGA